MDPLISVLVPVYNVENYLPRCLDSILEQTYTNLEILLVDDGSKDKSGEICDCYAEKDSRVRVIHTMNQGVAAARNTLVAEARGDYLMFVDSDDYITKKAVQILFERMEADGSDMAFGKHVEVYGNGQGKLSSCKWPQDSVLTGNQGLKKFAEEMCFATTPWGKVYKRKVFDGVVYPEFLCGEDTYVFPRIINNCEKITIVDSVVYYYYSNEKGLTRSRTEQMKKDAVSSFLEVTTYCVGKSFIMGAQKWYGRAIQVANGMQNKKEAREILLQSFDKQTRRMLMQKQDIKTWIRWIGLYIPFLYSIPYALYQPIKKITTPKAQTIDLNQIDC